ncbi:MAG TPA: tetratricopeptide repeat protein [Longimicrobiales bacterium]
MIDASRALQPLDEAAQAIGQLQTYESSAELAAALQETNAAVQRTLRSLLRFDRGAPDDLRMAALSPSELAPDRLIPTLRQRDLISLHLAGSIHELEQASRRAAEGHGRPSDADLALRVVDQLRDEVHRRAEREVRDVAHTAVTTGAVEEAPHVVPAATTPPRPMKIVAIIGAAVFVLLLIWGLFFRQSRTERGVEAYNARRYSEAQQIFQQEVESDVANATAAFYLARLYRRERRYADAAKVLHRAIQERPQDAVLQVEFGNVFMDLNQPAAAARRYQEAVTIDPENARNWVLLIRAQQAAGDPGADATLQRAPEEARALLQGRR